MKLYFPKNKKWFIFIPWLLFPFLCIGLYFLYVYRKPFVFINEKGNVNTQSQLTPFTDKIDGGNSECYLAKANSGVNYRYILRNKAEYAYAGVWYKSKTWFDLSAYDYVKIKAQMSFENWIGISLATHIPDFSVDSIVTTHKYLNQVMPVSLQSSEKILPLKEFTTPVWWYNINNKKGSDLEEADLTKVKYITFVHSPNNGYDTENKVVITELGFYVDYAPFYYRSAIALILYWSLSGLFFYVRRRKLLKRSVSFAYNKVESLNHKDREKSLVIDFLNNHFSTSELTIADIQSATGISERKISTIIKDFSGLSVKQFLNQIRINEAKKLLAETELPVVEIAFQCGYGSASHFNRIFKSVENCSPNDYRKNQFLITATI